MKNKKHFVLLIVTIHTIFVPSGVFVSGCGGVYNTDSGTITSPTPYRRGQTCVYKIELPFFSTWVRIQFLEFDIDGNMPDCSKDRVEVWTGCLTKARKIVTFCSKNTFSSTPHDVYSKERCTEIRLHASSEPSNTAAANGFSAKYETGDSSAKISDTCKRYEYVDRESGVIASPLWPEQFKKSDISKYYDKDCVWDIVTDRSRVVQINLMDIDFSKKMVNNPGCSNYGSNHLEIKGDKSVSKTTKDTVRYCSLPSELSYITDYYNIEVKLNGYYRTKVPERGFVLGYITYKKEDDQSKQLERGIIIGVIILSVIVVIISLFCYIKHRIKRLRAAHREDEVIFSSGNNTEPSATVVTRNQPLLNKEGYPAAVELPPPQPYPSSLSYPYVEPPSYHIDAPPPYPGPPTTESNAYPSPSVPI